jgi:hypothetical protein
MRVTYHDTIWEDATTDEGWVKRQDKIDEEAGDG